MLRPFNGLDCYPSIHIYLISDLVTMIMTESKCPYCGSIFENNEALSKHVDKIHNNEDAIGTQNF